MKRIVDYSLILKKVNQLITLSPRSTTHKMFVESFEGILSAKEANNFWDRLLIIGNVIKAIDNKRYEWLINSEWFTPQSIEKHFQQGDILSKRGRIPGKKYPKPKIIQKEPEFVLWPGWTSTISI